MISGGKDVMGMKELQMSGSLNVNLHFPRQYNCNYSQEIEHLYGMTPIRYTQSFNVSFRLSKDLIRDTEYLKNSLESHGMDADTIAKVLHTIDTTIDKSEDDDNYYSKVMATITSSIPTLCMTPALSISITLNTLFESTHPNFVQPRDESIVSPLIIEANASTPSDTALHTIIQHTVETQTVCISTQQQPRLCGLFGCFGKFGIIR